MGPNHSFTLCVLLIKNISNYFRLKLNKNQNVQGQPPRVEEVHGQACQPAHERRPLRGGCSLRLRPLHESGAGQCYRVHQAGPKAGEIYQYMSLIGILLFLDLKW